MGSPQQGSALTQCFHESIQRLCQLILGCVLQDSNAQALRLLTIGYIGTS